ncbi:hypothetical protein [Achromobacter ruhlandii]|uniref:Phage tail protein n=1 Tax=Achromobacter ruhlandii TaxID=72557 RepID=A0ABM8LZG5_9BURK|nr:hypothetical protein [Achromobacter ruhlandii]AOU92061.1 uncharacterized protein AruCF_1170 [Achromobacter ruhlandii]MDC6087236.1 hypothetical protein [Achromobacter ruhlandii]MDD7982138.1 hypothetical protein [Achromobacter ruhlandii]WIW04700.1 hypothetical protein PPH40_008730 [Achromobacter ruhlandii]CAB3954167.1 hypothetical protein LMG7053_04300 [Achromobacter ruhlandii]
MAINQILPFGTVPGANVLAPADYQALAARLGGFSAGTAKSKELNTVWRQASFVAAMIGQYIADKAGQDVLDDGDLAALQARFVAALAASPAFTGTPTAPTPAATDKSTRIATTAFVAGNFPRIYSIGALPTQDVGPIIVAECAEVWNWVSGQYYTGYRSPLCGRPLDGHTNLPLASEVDAIGGLLSKTDYAALWGYAQEQGLVKTEAVWSANRGSHWFSDYSATQFRVPDLRDMFRRFTGTDADTANARSLGTVQRGTLTVYDIGPNDAVLVGALGCQSANSARSIGADPANLSRYPILRVTTIGGGLIEAMNTPTAGVVRPENVAYHPRIHA